MMYHIVSHRNTGHAMKQLLGAALSVALILSAQTAASAQTSGAWPSRFVKVVVAFAAGGASDAVTRIVASEMSKNLGRSVVIENITGANGSLGTQAVARAEPDGYTFLSGTPGTLTINPHLFDKLPYDAANDFVSVAHVVTFPQVLAVGAKAPVSTLDEFVAYAKSKPGVLNYGSAGVGSTGHLVTAMFLSRAGIKAQHVPFRGGGPASQALVAGDIDFLIDGLPTFQGLAEAKLVKVLGITSAQRWPSLPDVPSLGERAAPGFDLSGWVIFSAPKGTPQPIIDRVSAEVKKAVSSADTQARLAQVGAIAIGSSPAEAAKFFDVEMEKWKEVVKVSGAKVPQ
jgi:tripartite-type tricarboxylate transporter receptor subunit TctC